MPDAASQQPRSMMRFALPLGVFVALVVLLGVGLSLDPREVPSPLIGKAVPVFDSDTAETLHARIQEQEHTAYPEALMLIASGQYTIGNTP